MKAGVRIGCGDPRLLSGTTVPHANAIRIEYALDGRPGRVVAALMHVRRSTDLRALRLRRPLGFGYYVVALPREADAVRVTALGRRGETLGGARPRP